MQRRQRCAAHSYSDATRWYAGSESLIGCFQRHIHTIFLISAHHDHILLPSDTHAEMKHVLSEILGASNDGGLAVVEAIHRLKTRLDVSHLINNSIIPIIHCH